MGFLTQLGRAIEQRHRLGENSNENRRNRSLARRIGIAGILVAAIVGVAQVGSAIWAELRPESRDRTDVVLKLLDDLERMKVLLPPDSVVEECLETRTNEPFREAFEACNSASRRDQTNALNLLDRNISRLRLVLSDNELDAVNPGLSAIRFAAAEMSNNSLAKAHWHSNGCPMSISFLDSSEVGQIPQDANGKVSCTLSVETYDNFINRGQPNDPLPAIVDATIARNKVKRFIVPGNEDTLDGYFLGLNTQLYKRMLQDMDMLIPTLRQIADR